VAFDALAPDALALVAAAVLECGGGAALRALAATGTAARAACTVALRVALADARAARAALLRASVQGDATAAAAAVAAYDAALARAGVAQPRRTSLRVLAAQGRGLGAARTLLAHACGTCELCERDGCLVPRNAFGAELVASGPLMVLACADCHAARAVRLVVEPLPNRQLRVGVLPVVDDAEDDADADAAETGDPPPAELSPSASAPAPPLAQTYARALTRASVAAARGVHTVWPSDVGPADQPVWRTLPHTTAAAVRLMPGRVTLWLQHSPGGDEGATGAPLSEAGSGDDDCVDPVTASEFHAALALTPSAAVGRVANAECARIQAEERAVRRTLAANQWLLRLTANAFKASRRALRAATLPAARASVARLLGEAVGSAQAGILLHVARPTVTHRLACDLLERSPQERDAVVRAAALAVELFAHYAPCLKTMHDVRAR